MAQPSRALATRSQGRSDRPRDRLERPVGDPEATPATHPHGERSMTTKPGFRLTLIALGATLMFAACSGGATPGAVSPPAGAPASAAPTTAAASGAAATLAPAGSTDAGGSGS